MDYRARYFIHKVTAGKKAQCTPKRENNGSNGNRYTRIIGWGFIARGPDPLGCLRDETEPGHRLATQ